jgi:hypothetical protein
MATTKDLKDTKDTLDMTGDGQVLSGVLGQGDWHARIEISFLVCGDGCFVFSSPTMDFFYAQSLAQ